MTKVLFFLILLALVAYGVSHDVGSRPTGAVVKGVIVEVRPAQSAFKNWPATGPRAAARLEDGRLVDVRLPLTHKTVAGDQASFVEMRAPWGSIWYALADGAEPR